MSAVEPSVVISEIGRRYLRLSLASDVGPVRLRNLVRHFGSIDSVLGASMAELMKVSQVGEVVARSVFKARGDEDVERALEQAAKGGVRILCAEDEEYPQSLLNIADPPICLFVRGGLLPTDVVSAAIVGTRRCSQYGAEQARRFGMVLGQAGFTVVSGLARGIDSYAHRGALQSSGRTIAVLGNGLATIYPPEHEALGAEIVERGALLSELPMDFQPDAKNFPPRNRIIAGLTLGVIVIEAGKRSGALITARLGSEYNREVFALPGRVDDAERTLGVHRMIRDGQAKLITCLEDVLDEFQEVGAIMRPEPDGLFDEEARADGMDKPVAGPAQIANLAPHERTIYEAIRDGCADVDEIHATTGLPVWRVNSSLTALQLKGLVRQLPGNQLTLRGKASG